MWAEIAGILGPETSEPFLNLPTALSDIDKGEYSRKIVNRASTGVTTILRGFSGPGLARRCLSTRRRRPQCEQGGCPERGANRASTGVATIVRGSSGPGSSRHRFSTRQWYPQCEQGDTQDKLHQPGFYRCGERRTIMWPTGLLPVWPRNCSREVMPGRAQRAEMTATATTLPANRSLTRKYFQTIPTGLLPVWLGLRSGSGNRIHIDFFSVSG
jgi:hypothetical protein